MKIEPKDVILWSVFDDEPNLVVNKASFGGDRSAAGRYAAEQRWKGHVKRQTRTDANRSTAQQLSEGPKNLAFGRDKNGLPIVGTRKELEARYGKTDEERAAYFQNKYGVKVNFVDLEGLDEDKYPDAIEVKLGAVQALDDMLSNLNVIPVGLTSKPPLAEIRIGTDNPMRNSLVSQSATAFVQHSNKDSRAFLLGLDTGDISNLAQHLLFSTTPITEQQALMGEDESPLDVINLRRLEEQSSQTIAGRFGISDASRDKGATWEKTTREDETTVARRLGYAIMIHEFGHVLDTLSFFDSKKRNNVKDMTSDRLEEDDSPAWRETEAVSEYGRYNTWEKMAEGFTAWFLFSQSANPVRYYSDLTNVGFSEASRWLKNQEVIDIKGASVPIVRPLLDSLRPPQTAEQVLKRAGDFVTTVADLPFDHPVIMFALQPFMDDGLMKAKVRVDAMIAAALAKASFGGDRSAAGRYAAQQRWKGHTKKEPKGPSGRSLPTQVRTTEQKLVEGPQSFAFGVDEKGLPVVGTIEQLEARFGKDYLAQEKYFKDKYGLKVVLGVGSGAKKRDPIEEYQTVLRHARLSALQALDDICSNLTRVPEGLEVFVTDRIMPTGYSSGHINGFVERNAEDSRLARLGVNIKTIDDCVGYLSGKQFPYERQQDIEEKVNVRFMYEGEPSAVQAVTTNLKSASEKDRSTIVSRLAYGVMVHEFGHVLDLKGPWLSVPTIALRYAHRSPEFDDDFREAPSVSGYGSISGKSRPQEKMAEGFAAWFLFSRSSNIVVPTYWDADGKTRRSLAAEVDIKDATSRLMRPLLDELKDVVKQLDISLDITKLLPTHPVLLFALQPFVDGGVEKARPENPWKRGYNTQYFRVRDAVLARKPLCYKCKKNRASEVDHVRPLINGGGNTVGNLRPICVSCNRKSGGGERRVKKSVRVDAMVDLAFEKASFGGDRSAAGRYAAEQRWKGHAKVSRKQPSEAKKIAEIEPQNSLNDTRRFAERSEDFTRRIAKQLADTFSFVDLTEAVLVQRTLGDILDSVQTVNLFRAYRRELADAKTGADVFKILNGISAAENAKPRLFGSWQQERLELIRLSGAIGQDTDDALTQADILVHGFKQSWTAGSGEAKGMVTALAREALGASSNRSESAEYERKHDKEYTGVLNKSPNAKKVLTALVKEIYADSQQILKEILPEGTTHVRVFRGTALTDEQLKAAQKGLLDVSTVSSWTQDRRIAVQFRAPDKQNTIGGEKRLTVSVLTAVVPISSFFGFTRQGFGTMGEAEMMVLGPSVEIEKVETGSALEKAQVRRDAMVAAALSKASFGGDRSAAGRYAAEQRWKGHVKAEPKGRDFREVMATFRTVAEMFQERVKQDAKGLSDKDLQREFDAIDPVTEPTLEEQTYAGWKKQALAELISERKIERARGGIVEHVRSFDGMSVKIESGEQPVDGFMVARREHSRIVTAEEFFDETKGKQILSEFLKENRRRFGKDQFLGIWHNEENGMVYLDITDNIRDRSEAERLGRERNQISIWDVVNMVEIKTGGTGEG